MENGVAHYLALVLVKMLAQAGRGTTPQTRGKEAAKVRLGIIQGNNPAYAGKVPGFFRARRAVWNNPAGAGKVTLGRVNAPPGEEQPRVCGEKG